VSSLAADLVNTRPRPADPAEKLTGPDAVAALLSAHGIEGRDVGAAARALGSVGGVRGTRHGIARGGLEPLLARAPASQLMPGWSLRTPTEELPADRVAVAAALELASLAAAHGLDRLGFCAADDCQRVFADTSARGSRRYCSRTCSTRTNVRRHRKTAH
jgi:hypothetical protein